MADDILLDHNIAGHKEGAPEEIILAKSTLEEAIEATQLPGHEESAFHEDNETDVNTDADIGNSHDVANVVAAIDAFLADPNDSGEELQSEDHEDHDESHAESQEQSVCGSHNDDQDESHDDERSEKTDDDHAAQDLKTTNAEEDHADDSAEAHTEEATEEAVEHNDNLPAVDLPRDLSATVEDETPEELAERATFESAEAEEEEHNDGEEQDESHIVEPLEEMVESHEESFAQSVEGNDEHSELEQEEEGEKEEHEDDSVAEHDEADVSIADSALSHGDESELVHDDEAPEDEHEEHEEHEEHVEHDAPQDDEDASRRSSASSSRSGVSNRRTSLRTEALIQAAARAVVAKINEKDSTNSHFDIMRAMSESHESILEEADHHTTTDEDGENDHEGDAELDDDDDVFSDRSPRSSLGSFEHNSGVSNNGADDRHQKEDHITTEDVADTLESEDEHDYVGDTGSVAYHRDTSHYSPRMSGVSGISHLSQYEQHRENEEEYNDGGEYVPHTIRGTPRAAFRTPSSVRAIQMSSPSPSIIFGVSPRSAARRRRLGTGSGLDDGQSMGSVATYSSLPGSPSKNHTPTRFKVFRKPEPAPLVLLHATLMPTRWVWSDVLRTLDDSLSHSASERLGSRSSSAIGSASKSRGKNDLSLSGRDAIEVASFEPSAALKRLHGAWCQLQDYSLGADTVAERGVLLPHPQNDYEVLEERLLEALELPVRRRARILECGHYLGPADDEDDDDYEREDDDYYNDRADEDDANKRHWCTTCRSDIRYESLGAERVFRVKVYASNGLMTVGAWAACWSEMERVDVEIEPIVADAALFRELNQLRNLQQQEALRKQEEEDAAAEAAMEEHEEEIHADDDLLHEHDVHDAHDEHDDHGEHEEIKRSSAAVDHFHLAPPSVIPVSPPLRDSPVEPPAITTTDHASDADRRRREAEDRLREIYGRTPPQMAHPVAPTSHSHHVESTRLSDVPETVETAATRDMDDGHSPFGPSPPSPSAEAYERREERRHRQFSSAERSFSDGPAGSAPYAHHPQAPYESASLPELLLAAIKVFLRDRKHVAITVLSIIVILLVTLRSPGAGDQGTHSVHSQASDVHPALEYSYQPVGVVGDARIDFPQKGVEASTAVMSESVLAEIASSVASVDSLVETVVEKMTVKVYETVTETATETATQTTIETAATEAPVGIFATVLAETARVEAVESVESAEPTWATVVAEPAVEEQQSTVEAELDVESSVATSAASLSPGEDTASLFAPTDASTSAAEPTSLVAEEGDHDEL